MENKDFLIKTNAHGDIVFTYLSVGRYISAFEVVTSDSKTHCTDFVKKLAHCLILKMNGDVWDLERIENDKDGFSKIKLILTHKELEEFSEKFLAKHGSFLGEKESSIKINGKPLKRVYTEKEQLEFEKIKNIKDPIQRLCKAYDLHMQRMMKQAGESLNLSNSLLKNISTQAIMSYTDADDRLNSLLSTPEALAVEEESTSEGIKTLIELAKVEIELSRKSSQIFQEIYSHQTETTEKQSKSAKREAKVALVFSILSLIVSIISVCVGAYYAKNSFEQDRLSIENSKVEEILNKLETNTSKYSESVEIIIRELKMLRVELSKK